MNAILLSMALFACSAPLPSSSSANYAAQAAEADVVDVTVETAGSLGVEILYKVNVLADVVNLRITGPLDDTDWTTISNLNNLVTIDMQNARSSAVPDNAFTKCTSLKYCVLPSILTQVGANAFKNTKLAEIDIPASVTSIGQEAFSNLSSLAAVTFETNSMLKSLGQYAFYRCSNLETIQLPDPLTKIQSYTFRECTKLKEVKLPVKLKVIDSYAFYKTSALQNIEFPTTLTTIESNAFYQSGLQSIIIPANVSKLGTYCFANCANATEVQLPSYLTDDNLYYTFSSSTSITRVVCPQLCPAEGKYSPFASGIFANATLIVPDASVALYKLSTYWMQFGTIVGGANTDKCIIDGNFMLTGDRRIDGSPALEILNTGKFTISGQTP